MKLLDANVLLYAYDSEATQHTACGAWMEDALNDEETVARHGKSLLPLSALPPIPALCGGLSPERTRATSLTLGYSGPMSSYPMQP